MKYFDVFSKIELFINMTKTCSICEKEKPLMEFSKNAHSKNGLLASCKICENNKQEKMRKANRIKNKTLNLKGVKRCSRCEKWKSKLEFHVNRCQNDGLCSYCKDCFKIKRIAYQKIDLRRFLLSSAKYRAKKKRLEFNLKKDDIEIPETCPVFNIPLQYSEGGKTDNSPTLDRIDNSLGYVKGNIVVTSFKANRIKNNATIEELKQLTDFYSKQKVTQCATSTN